MESDRRTFLWQSAGLAAATLIGAQTAAEDRQAASPAELLKRMSWMNEPASSNLVGDKLAVRSRAKTDFWRKTFYGYITDNGHFFHLPASGDFIFQTRINGQYAALYDQAGLMVRKDAENWMKCGTEFFDDRLTRAWCSRATFRIGRPCRISQILRPSGGEQSERRTR